VTETEGYEGILLPFGICPKGFFSSSSRRFPAKGGMTSEKAFYCHRWRRQSRQCFSNAAPLPRLSNHRNCQSDPAIRIPSGGPTPGIYRDYLARCCHSGRRSGLSYRTGSFYRRSSIRDCFGWRFSPCPISLPYLRVDDCGNP